MENDSGDSDPTRSSLPTEGPPHAVPPSVSGSSKLSYSPVHSVQRVLSLLRALNRQRVNSVDQLHRETGLPKSTVVRMLETLLTEGYVTRDKCQSGYLVTSLVQSLSCGFHGEPLIVQAARPWAAALTRRLQWPVSVALLDCGEMVVRFSTVSESPNPPVHSTINMRLNLIDRAMGLVYLAFCPESERLLLMHVLETTATEALEHAGGRYLLERKLRRIREQGYATRGAAVPPLGAGTVAVPIRDGAHVLATLGMGYFHCAVSDAVLRDQYVPVLREAAGRIVAQIRSLRESVEVGSSVVPATHAGSR